MLLASIVGDPVGAIVAAIVAPVCFVILFILLAKDPGPRRHVGEEHPAYVEHRDRNVARQGR
jgi:hypothetical protein